MSDPETPQIDITDAQLRELRLGAYEDGDREWVATCNRALAGDQDALEQCGQIIEGAGAPMEPE